MACLEIFERRVVLWVIHFSECKRVGAGGSGKVKFCLGEKQEFGFAFIRFMIFVRLLVKNLFNIFLSDIKILAVSSPQCSHCM